MRTLQVQDSQCGKQHPAEKLCAGFIMERTYVHFKGCVGSRDCVSFICMLASELALARLIICI